MRRAALRSLAELIPTPVDWFMICAFELDTAVAERCVALTAQLEMISANTHFHWWPRQRQMK